MMVSLSSSTYSSMLSKTKRLTKDFYVPCHLLPPLGSSSGLHIDKFVATWTLLLTGKDKMEPRT